MTGASAKWMQKAFTQDISIQTAHLLGSQQLAWLLEKNVATVISKNAPNAWAASLMARCSFPAEVMGTATELKQRGMIRQTYLCNKT